jgi:phosphate butyryltransferase
MNEVKAGEKQNIAVVAAEDTEVLQMVGMAIEEGLAKFVLIGAQDQIRENMKAAGLDFPAEIIDEPNHKKAAEKAVELVKVGQVGAIMKGMLHTATFLKAVLNKETGLNTGKLISQVSIYDKPFGDGLQLLTDCAMAIQPTLDEKKEIIENAAYLARKLGYELPRVALLSALEVVNPKIPDTMEAAVLSKMCDRGQIKGCLVDGPFALDNAISPEAAAMKKVKSPVAGVADVLVAPNLQVGNVLTKALTYFGGLDVAAAVVGATAPIIMTSRTDSKRNKLLSIALAAYVSG